MATKDKELAAGFTKDQFLQSRQWQGIDKDILSVVLEPSKTYTIAEAKRLIDQFKQGQVKG
ncbi:hypothetical protein [Paenibacillus apis]|uniref:YqzN/YkzM domain-containing protein n=1 Tax=Paenibacillus apis TaxID=1792174 RepID=A0A920CKF3_9BACL|nr:hypothetical protein [Paenibacillus apis]GIO42475.1 hypothetical protein J41TS4_22330 [Paenibacillus apis]